MISLLKKYKVELVANNNNTIDLLYKGSKMPLSCEMLHRRFNGDFYVSGYLSLEHMYNDITYTVLEYKPEFIASIEEDLGIEINTKKMFTPSYIKFNAQLDNIQEIDKLDNIDSQNIINLALQHLVCGDTPSEYIFLNERYNVPPSDIVEINRFDKTNSKT